MKRHTLTAKQIPLNENYDVIVVGGGPAGCAAAIAAAREGCKTLIIEASSALGGMGTLGLVPWFCGYHDGEKILARGIAEKILNFCRDNTPHLKKRLSENPLASPAIDPELLKRIYDDMITEAGVDVIFGSQFCSVELERAGQVDTIIVSNKRGLTAYRATLYIDCTGDGDLAAWAGADFEKGDENGKMQPATHCFMITNIDEYALENGARIHCYDPDSPVHKAVRSSKYPLIIDLHSCLIQVGPRTYGFNTGHVYDVDSTDPENVSKSLIEGRKKVSQYSAAFKEFHPAFQNAFLCSTGSILGIRESRRIIGDYKLTIEDYTAKQSFPDEICRNAYGADVHDSSKENAIRVSHKSIEEIKERNRQIMMHLKPGESFGVPYRCLTPKGLDNVLVAGRCISADRRVNGSVRIMACCLTTGEAAGVAAASAMQSSSSIHSVNTDKLRQKLKDNGAYLP